MSFGVFYGNRGSFRIQPDDGADPLAQVFVGETNGVADEELFALCARRRCRFGMNRGALAIGNDRRIRVAPSAAGSHCPERSPVRVEARRRCLATEVPAGCRRYS